MISKGSVAWGPDWMPITPKRGSLFHADLHIWVPRSDRQKIFDQLPTGSHGAFLDALPLNYDDTTLKTIEQIDVIWLKGRSMARALRASQNG